jgi:hypothetical protein
MRANKEVRSTDGGHQEAPLWLILHDILSMLTNPAQNTNCDITAD